MKSRKLHIFIDGGSRGNPGRGACAAVFFDEKGSLVKEAGRHLGRCTNNFAEYNALMLALSGAERLGAADIRIFSDSELLVRQFNGQYKIKDAVLKTLIAEIRKLTGAFNRVTLSHVPRGGNKHADRLVNDMLDKAEDGPSPAKSVSRGRRQEHYQPDLF